jgi:hypothetical protein
LSIFEELLTFVAINWQWEERNNEAKVREEMRVVENFIENLPKSRNFAQQAHISATAEYTNDNSKIS